MSKFKTLRTMSGIEIRVRPNYSARHFTIKANGFKYRTNQLPQSEFNSYEYYTGCDWLNFLRGCDEYYRV